MVAQETDALLTCMGPKRGLAVGRPQADRRTWEMSYGVQDGKSVWRESPVMCVQLELCRRRLRSESMKVAALRLLLGFALGTVSAQGQELLTTSDGVTLNGTVRLLRSDAATCNVVAENAGNRYDELKVNQGQPLHLWELEFSVFNGSGRPLDHLAAYYSIESPWPPCTNWTNHYELQGNIATVPVQWSSPSGRIQQTGRATPTRAGETHSETILLLALHGVRPQFSDWSVNYTFVDSGAPPVPPPHVTATGTELAPRAEPATPAVAAHANQTPELIAFWDGSDETNKATVDHSAWQALLDAYLAPHPSGVNRFNYAGLTAAPDDLAKLNGYLAQLEAMDPPHLCAGGAEVLLDQLLQRVDRQGRRRRLPGGLDQGSPRGLDPTHRALGRRACRDRRSGVDSRRHPAPHPATHLARPAHSLRFEHRQHRLPEPRHGGIHGRQHRVALGCRRTRIRQPPPRRGHRGRRVHRPFKHLRMVEVRLRRFRRRHARASDRIRRRRTRSATARLRGRNRL